MAPSDAFRHLFGNYLEGTHTFPKDFVASALPCAKLAAVRQSRPAPFHGKQSIPGAADAVAGEMDGGIHLGPGGVPWHSRLDTRLYWRVKEKKQPYQESSQHELAPEKSLSKYGPCDQS